LIFFPLFFFFFLTPHLVGASTSRGRSHCVEGAVGHGEKVRRVRRAVPNVRVLAHRLVRVQALDLLKGVDGHQNLHEREREKRNQSRQEKGKDEFLKFNYF
jgi:hypothetical protein